MALCVLHLLACSHAIALLRAQEVQAEKEAKRLEKAAKLAAKRAARTRDARRTMCGRADDGTCGCGVASRCCRRAAHTGRNAQLCPISHALALR